MLNEFNIDQLSLIDDWRLLNCPTALDPCGATDRSRVQIYIRRLLLFYYIVILLYLVVEIVNCSKDEGK